MAPDQTAADAEIDRIKAATQLIARTGATALQVHYVDPEPGEIPVTTWLATATYSQGGWEVAAGQTAQIACERLLEELLDGTGVCNHCHKPTTVLHELTDVAPFGDLCAYQYDPESKTYYRGCEHG